ncbi:Catechol 2,3-dioxygenase-like lactoylglutathione lyase family enzyme OS=Castellaniella defragrans OX=75697 GN=HNR28_001311 PE=4 SV=1 [Castellaniella defragrans]
MALKHIVGVDHIVIAVRNLDAAARAWQAAGFTVSPRGKHSEHIGTANYTIVFGHDYMELLGVDHETAHNQPTVAFLKQREGVERAAFTTDDAAALADEIKAHGFAATGPVAFSRPVALPDGAASEARFQVTAWPVAEAPAGLRVFACQHFTRDAVWIPSLQHHANGAQGLVRLEIVAGDSKAEATQLARLIDQTAQPTASGFRVPSGSDRAVFEFYDAAAFARRYPAAIRAGSAGHGPVALVIASDDLAQAGALEGAILHDGAVNLPAERTNGVIVGFVAR